MTDSPQPGLVLGPGYRLLQELDARGWTQKDLAEILGRPIQAINEITRGAKQITPETAIQLGQAFRMAPDFWLNLESTYRLRLAERRSPVTDEVALRSRLYELVPVPELIRRGWIKAGTSVRDLERAVIRFLRMRDIDDEPQVPIARLRNTPSRSPESRARLAWTMRAAWLAETSKPSASYDPTHLQATLADLFSLSKDPARISDLRRALGKVGVRFVVVPHLPQTYLDGAAFWLDDVPVVAVTLRFDRLDWLWFTVAHEIAHLLNDPRDGVVDEARSASMRAPSEEAADEAAQNWLVPTESYRQFLAETGERPSRADIARFAEEIERHPSVVLGRLQHDGVLSWSQMRDLHVPVRQSLEPIVDHPISRDISVNAPT